MADQSVDTIFTLAVINLNYDLAREIRSNGEGEFLINKASSWLIESHLIDEASNGNVRAVDFFIKNGVVRQSKLDKAFVKAVSNGHLEVVKLLIDIGVDIHIERRWTWDMIILSAVRQNKMEAVKFLIDSGILHNHSMDGILPLLINKSYFVFDGYNLEAIKYLLFDCKVRVWPRIREEFKNNYSDVYELILKRDINESIKEKLKPSPDSAKNKVVKI